MPHNPVKSIKIDFHTADGVTPKPQPLPESPSTAGEARGGMDKVPAPQTTLSPLHEVLFKHWATANGIPETDHPDNHYDYRGFFAQSGGQIHPPGAVENAASTFNRIKQNPLQLSAPGVGTAPGASAAKAEAMIAAGGPPPLPPPPAGFMAQSHQSPMPTPMGGNLSAPGIQSIPALNAQKAQILSNPQQSGALEELLRMLPGGGRLSN